MFAIFYDVKHFFVKLNFNKSVARIKIYQHLNISIDEMLLGFGTWYYVANIEPLTSRFSRVRTDWTTDLLFSRVRTGLKPLTSRFLGFARTRTTDLLFSRRDLNSSVT